MTMLIKSNKHQTLLVVQSVYDKSSKCEARFNVVIAKHATQLAVSGTNDFCLLDSHISRSLNMIQS